MAIKELVHLTRLSARDETGAAFNSASRNARGLNNEIQKLSVNMRAFLGLGTLVATAGLTSKKLVEMADSYTLLASRVKLASDDHKEYAYAMQEISKIAKETRSPIEAIGTLYSRIGLAVKGAGVAQKDVLDTIKALSAALTVNGATVEEANAAMLQFSQAMAKGNINGDEFRTLWEAAPGYMRELAKSLGVSTAELLEMSRAGELTRDKVIGASKQIADVFTDQMAGIPKTFGQAMTESKNIMFEFVGQLGQALTASKSLGEGIVAMAKLGTQALGYLSLAGLGIKKLFVDVGRAIGAGAAIQMAEWEGDLERARRIQAQYRKDVAASDIDYADTLAKIHALIDSNIDKLEDSSKSEKKAAALTKDAFEEKVKAVKSYDKEIKSLATDLKKAENDLTEFYKKAKQESANFERESSARIADRERWVSNGRQDKPYTETEVSRALTSAEALIGDDPKAAEKAFESINSMISSAAAADKNFDPVQYQKKLEEGLRSAKEASDKQEEETLTEKAEAVRVQIAQLRSEVENAFEDIKLKFNTDEFKADMQKLADETRAMFTNAGLGSPFAFANDQSGYGQTKSSMREFYNGQGSGFTQQARLYDPNYAGGQEGIDFINSEAARKAAESANREAARAGTEQGVVAGVQAAAPKVKEETNGLMAAAGELLIESSKDAAQAMGTILIWPFKKLFEMASDYQKSIPEAYDARAELAAQVGLKPGEYATGGFVSGPGTSTSDSIPAMLSNGEFVMRTAAVNSLGVGMLDYINRNGTLPGFADGGLVGDAFASDTSAKNPVNLYLNGQSFKVAAGDDTVRELTRAFARENLKAGRR